MTKLVLKFILVLMFAPPILAQGEFKQTINWQEIKTPYVSIIYPPSLTQKANRIANIIDAVERIKPSKPIKHTPKIILNNQGVSSNGYAALAPIRSEFYTTPPQDNTVFGGGDWLDLLAIHEYTHLQQFKNNRIGLNKWSYLLFGELGLAITQNLLLPNWYFEGDAVFFETQLSSSGRGRLNTFYANYAQSLDKSYHYRDFVNNAYNKIRPSVYPVGYAMLSLLRREFHDSIVKEIVQNSHKNVSHFTFELKKQTGYTPNQLFQKTNAYFLNQLKNTKPTFSIKSTTLSNSPKKTISYYHFPKFTDQNNVIAIKSSRKQLAKIIDVETNKTLYRNLPNFNHYYDFKQNAFVWCEKTIDPRRGESEYTDVFLLKNRKRKRLTRHQKLFSPIFAKDTTKIICLSRQENNQFCLIQIDINSKQIQTLHKFQKDQQIGRITAISKQKIAFIKQQNNKSNIAIIDLKTKKIKDLTKPKTIAIDHLYFKKNHLYFSASYNGILNIFRTKIDTNLVEQLTNSRFGAEQPCVSNDGKSMLFLENTPTGNQVKVLTLSPFKPSEIKTSTISFYKHKPSLTIKNKRYKSTPYRPKYWDLKWHSITTSNNNTTPSLKALWDNYLNDVSFESEIGYNQNEKGFFAKLSYEYAKLFPILTLSTRWQNRQNDNLFTLLPTLKIPLFWNHNRFSTRLTYHLQTPLIAQIQTLRSTSSVHLAQSIYFGYYQKTTRQHIKSRLGFGISASFAKPFSSNENKLFGLLNVNLPSIFPTHYLKFHLAYQREPTSNQFRYTNRFPYPRGSFDFPTHDKVKKWGMEYGLPLIYPNFGIVGLTYFKRIYAIGFLERATFQHLHSTTTQSAGIELHFNNRILNMLEVHFGFRFSHITNENTPVFRTEFLWSALF